MRLTDDRYANERSQFELALRMIRHEARTHTIKGCTGLSDDRIRKLYATYFRDTGNRKVKRRRGINAAGTTIILTTHYLEEAGNGKVKRRRGKSPQQIGPFVKPPRNQLEATTLIALFCASLLLRIDSANRVHACWPRPDVEYGHRVCRAFETYLLLHPRPRLSFERAWSLLQNISKNDELILATCAGCQTTYVQDAYALDHRTCPSCEISQCREGRLITGPTGKI